MTQLEFALDFTHAEVEIAHYILNHGEDVLNLSIKELAKRTYTSPATIVRLCRKLGLEGYNDFKIKYSAELQYTLTKTKRIDVNFPFGPEDNYPQIAYKLGTMSREVIEDTIKLIDFDELRQAIELMNQHESIDIYGNGNSMLEALSFQHKMTRIGRNVNIRTLEGEQIFLAYNSTPDHLAMILSYSGETAEIIRIAQTLKEKGTKMIVITSLGDNQLSHYGDVILRVGSREKIFTKIAPFASNLSMDYILNLIFSCIFQRDYNRNLEKKINYVKELNSYLIKKLKMINGISINSPKYAIPNTINFSIKNAKIIVNKLYEKGVYVSMQSACSLGTSPSKSVYALTKSKERASNSIRVSITHITTKKQINEFIRILKEIINEDNNY